MKINGTDLTLSMHGGTYFLKSKDGLEVAFTHYKDLKISKQTEKSYFVGYIIHHGNLVSVCEIQGANAGAVYDAVANYNMR